MACDASVSNVAANGSRKEDVVVTSYKKRRAPASAGQRLEMALYVVEMLQILEEVIDESQEAESVISISDEEVTLEEIYLDDTENDSVHEIQVGEQILEEIMEVDENKLETAESVIVLSDDEVTFKEFSLQLGAGKDDQIRLAETSSRKPGGNNEDQNKDDVTSSQVNCSVDEVTLEEINLDDTENNGGEQESQRRVIGQILEEVIDKVEIAESVVSVFS